MKEIYYADKNRYSNGMAFERCGRSGVLLPKVSLGFWHNFGSVDPYERSRVWLITMDPSMVLLKKRWAG